MLLKTTYGSKDSTTYQKIIDRRKERVQMLRCEARKSIAESTGRQGPLLPQMKRHMQSVDFDEDFTSECQRDVLLVPEKGSFDFENE